MYKIVFSNKGFSLERLRLLCDVARTGGIRAAVGDDPVRQSLASRQLKELNEYANTELTRRVGRGLEMTDAGKEFVEIGSEFFSKMETFLKHVRNLPVDFNLGVGDSIFQWQILPKMKTFETHFRNIRLISHSYSAPDIIKAVEARRLDAGIVRRTAVTDTELIVKHIGEIRYRLFIPRPFIKSLRHNQSPSISEIPFCTLTGDGEYAKNMTRFLAAFNGTSALNCSSMTQMFAAVQSGQYAAILPANAKSNLIEPATRVFTLPELAPFTRQISLIFKRDLKDSPEKNSILDFLSTCID